MNKDRGIILLAIGNAAYGNFAANLALSLKSSNPELPIQVVYEKGTLSQINEWHRSFFDLFTEINTDHVYQDGKFCPAKAKLQLYNYSAFKETIYLDVDSLCIKNIDPIFDMCKDGYYYSQVVGTYEIKGKDDHFDGIQWAHIPQMIKYFKLKKGDVIPAINSSFQYFRKSKECEKLFKQAIDNLNNPIPAEDRNMKWGKANLQPDELYMDIALAQAGLVPEMKTPLVMYFNSSRMKSISDFEKDFFFLGLYGSIRFTHSSLQDYYDRYMMKVCREVHGKSHLFKINNLMRRKIS